MNSWNLGEFEMIAAFAHLKQARVSASRKFLGPAFVIFESEAVDCLDRFERFASFATPRIEHDFARIPKFQTPKSKPIFV